MPLRHRAVHSCHQGKELDPTHQPLVDRWTVYNPMEILSLCLQSVGHGFVTETVGLLRMGS
ncbi:rCG24675 [Rattus norvegicus]|uniref:RCG24675 n=1 Tax=Rattus norvegicus TaxID=10116 RepID=A6JBZ4_RAT|nr:rCG24675 [Rattus norvegicus]